jgi:hypothetical protein
MRAAIVAAVIVCLAGPAHAEKKRKTAVALAGAGTAVTAGLVLSSFLVPADGTVFKPTFYAGLGTSIVTPSLGQFYSGTYFSIGMGIRAGAAIAAIIGIAQTRDDRCFIDPNEICPTLTGTGFAILSVAAIGYIGGIAYDLLDTPKAVERRNRASVMVAPTVTDRSAGLALVGSF